MSSAQQVDNQKVVSVDFGKQVYFIFYYLWFEFSIVQHACKDTR